MSHERWSLSDQRPDKQGLIEEPSRALEKSRQARWGSVNGGRARDMYPKAFFCRSKRVRNQS